MFEAFHAQHKAEYGHVFRDSPIEIVNIRVTGIAAGPKLGRPVVTPGGSLDRARAKTGRCLFRLAGRLEAFDTPFYRRGLLPLDTVIPGPAIVLQEDSTTVVPPRCSLVAEASGNLIIRIGGAS